MKSLTFNQLNQYNEQGFVAPIDVLSIKDANNIRQEIDAIENQWPNELDGIGRNYVHMISPVLDEVCHNFIFLTFGDL